MYTLRASGRRFQAEIKIELARSVYLFLPLLSFVFYFCDCALTRSVIFSSFIHSPPILHHILFDTMKNSSHEFQKQNKSTLDSYCHELWIELFLAGLLRTLYHEIYTVRPNVQS